LNDKVSRFLEWKKHLRADPDYMGGTTTFPNTRLTVRHIGGMLERHAYAEEIVSGRNIGRLPLSEFSGLGICTSICPCLS